MGIIEVLLEHTSFKGLLVFISVSWILLKAVSYADTRKRLNRLPGGPPPKIPSSWPLGEYNMCAPTLKDLADVVLRP